MDIEKARNDIDALSQRLSQLTVEAVGARTLYLIGAVTAHAANLLREVADWEASFDLYHKADMRGIALWRAEAPAERELIQPDKGNLVAWLLARLDESEADLAAARAAYREEWDCFDDEAVAGLMRTAIATALHYREQFKARGGEMDAAEAELERLRAAARTTIAGEHTPAAVRERLRAALGEERANA